MGVYETLKCAFHEETSRDNYIKLDGDDKDRLIHEHLFTESAGFCLSCLTCGESYCNRCGRLVGNQNKTIPEVSMKMH
jgi:hypothetical protein